MTTAVAAETEVFDLDALIAEAERVDREAAEQQQRRQREADERKRKALLDGIRQRWNDLNQPMLEALRATVTEHGIRVYVGDDEEEQSVYWHLWPSTTCPAPGEASQWYVRRDQVGYQSTGPLDADAVPGVLVRKIGEWRKAVADLRERNEAQRKRNAEIVAREQREAEQGRLLHEELAKLVEERVRDEAAALWKWPAGLSVTLYRWRYQCGIGDGGEPDYAEAWAPVDYLNNSGYVRLGVPYSDDAKLVRLNPQFHLPVIEAHTFTAADQLPWSLLKTVECKVFGVKHAYGWDGLERGDAGDYVVREVGERPAKWICDYVDGVRKAKC